MWAEGFFAVKLVDFDCEDIVFGGPARFADCALANGGYRLSGCVCYAAKNLVIMVSVFTSSVALRIASMCRGGI
jgi:hypothetical protein